MVPEGDLNLYAQKGLSPMALITTLLKYGDFKRGFESTRARHHGKNIVVINSAAVRNVIQKLIIYKTKSKSTLNKTPVLRQKFAVPHNTMF